MTSDFLIRCDGVGKRFCRDLKRSLWYGLKDCTADVVGWIGKSEGASDWTELRPAEFWANRDINFEVKRGECIGLIGRNGAGKTTLLKLLNGLIKPDAGKIEIRGQVGALIALGAGFNPILTGRENILINGSILGLSRKRIEDRLEEIVEFSELHEFIDSPVRNYSSGMQVRLGFAAASLLVEPDVLILDEVLAVGDSAFRHRCYAKVNQLMKRSAVILVSHSMEHIAQCATKVGLMQKGEMTTYVDTNEGIEAYNRNNLSNSKLDQQEKVKSLLAPVTAVEVSLSNTDLAYGESLSVTVELESSAAVDDVELFFAAIDLNQKPVMCWSSTRCGHNIAISSGRQTFEFSIDQLTLHDGTYTWNLMIGKKESMERFVWMTHAGQFEVSSPFRPLSNIPYLPMDGGFRINRENTT